jgi:hypothetical protein
MKRFFLVLVCLLAACGTDEPEGTSNNLNNTTNNSTNIAMGICA